jgi:hypothetical protein
MAHQPHLADDVAATQAADNRVTSAENIDLAAEQNVQLFAAFAAARDVKAWFGVSELAHKDDDLRLERSQIRE